MTRIVDAKFLKGKGSPEQQRAFVEELIRLRFKRLHDPIRPGKSEPDPKAAREQREERERAELERLKAKRTELGIGEFREPYPVDTPASYESAMRQAAREAGSEVVRDLAASKRAAR